jgi:adenine C2-methylase RlmN of 23S rRNA A2503 and tRNA A37
VFSHALARPTYTFSGLGSIPGFETGWIDSSIKINLHAGIKTIRRRIIKHCLKLQLASLFQKNEIFVTKSCATIGIETARLGTMTVC